jgi:hypothetical protein
VVERVMTQGSPDSRSAHPWLTVSMDRTLEQHMNDFALKV